jgi:hypothetical protein
VSADQAKTEIGLWQVAVDGLIRVADHIQPEVRFAIAGIAADVGPATAALSQSGRSVALADGPFNLDIGSHLFVSL